MYVKYKDYTPEYKYGYYPHERSMELMLKYGAVIVDKISGPTSQNISVWVKEILRAKKAGHVGTLDPKVTGVLPILLNNSNKLMSYLHALPKKYVVLMKLHQEIDEEIIKNTINSFKGKDYYHVPPLKSAVKRVRRKRKIYDIKVLEIEGKYVLFEAEVESGTYIRSLCIDIGKAMSIKAQMYELRRILSAGFDESHVVDLYTLKEYAYFYYEKGDDSYLKNIIYPMERFVKFIPKIIVKENAGINVLNGSPLYYKGIYMADENISKGDIVGIMSVKGELLAIHKSEGSIQDIKKNFSGIASKPLRVVIDKKDYIID